MESSGLLSTLRRRAPLVILMTLIGLAVAAVAVLSLPRTYESRATLFLSVKAASTSLYERSQFALQRVQSYPQLLDSPTLLASVISTLDLKETPQELDQQVSAENPTNTVLLNVTATASTPEAAAAIANTAADALAKDVNTLENSETTSKNAVALVPQIAAQAPIAPSSPNRPVVIGLGVVAGFVLGALLALLLERFAPRVRTVADVRRVTGLPVVAELPRSRRRARTAAATAAANLRAITRGDLPPVLLLTPAGARAEQAAAHLDLAWGLSQTGRRVAAIASADDRTDGLGVAVEQGAPGLSEVLAGSKQASEVAIRVPDRDFDLIPAGDPASAPSAFALERRSTSAFAPVVEGHDVVVLQSTPDSRPLDLGIAGRVARSALIVVSRRSTSEHDLRRTLAEVRALDIVPIGVIVADVAAVSDDLIEHWSEGDFLRVEVDGRTGAGVVAVHDR